MKIGKMSKLMTTHQKFELVPEDIGMRLHVRGKTCRELFRNALVGVAAYMKSDAVALSKNQQNEREEISIETPDLNSLLVDFLSGVIAHADSRSAVFTGITFKKFGENFLSGELTGIPADGSVREIRAVSYSDVDIRKNQKTGLYEATLVLEV